MGVWLRLWLRTMMSVVVAVAMRSTLIWVAEQKPEKELHDIILHVAGAAAVDTFT